ncbi:MAG: tol-pal system protein YbgF, partial [Humidesulfovibrio sp.]|nr:tol-pal system protein YbgF [Humidesulfovibrio sp.]
AGKMDAKRGLSEEWRLRSLEENFLNFKEGQRQQEEQGRDQQRKMMERMKAVEDSVQRMQEQLNAGGVVMPLKKAAPATTPAPMAPVVAPVVVGAQPGTTPIYTAKPEAVQPEPSPSAASQPATPQAEPAESPAPAPAPAMTPDVAQGEQQTAPAATPARTLAKGAALYHEGMTLVAADHPEEGRKLLQEFLSTEPNSVLVPNALYWLGESHYADKHYAQAIMSFKEVTRRYPKHTKAAAALLKIGMSYAMMGEKDNASLYLRALLQDFPKSEPAPLARKKLAELGR